MAKCRDFDLSTTEANDVLKLLWCEKILKSMACDDSEIQVLYKHKRQEKAQKKSLTYTAALRIGEMQVDYSQEESVMQEAERDYAGNA